jgi:hypothetical protein
MTRAQALGDYRWMRQTLVIAALLAAPSIASAQTSDDLIRRGIEEDQRRATTRQQEQAHLVATADANILPGALVFGLSYLASLAAGIYGLAGPLDAAAYAGACVPLGGALPGMRTGNIGYIVFAVSDTLTQWLGVGLLISALAAPRRSVNRAGVTFTGNGLLVRF